MPEILEIEYYRRTAEPCVGRKVKAVEAPDDWFLKHGATEAELRERLVGETITATRRIGKLLMLDITGGTTLGLRFGMTGRLIVDESPVIDRLEYTSHRDEPAWDRLWLRFGTKGSMRLQDPRRLGAIEIDPDLSKMGLDAWSLDTESLQAVLGNSAAKLKARMMDQSRLAGLGNLLTDEILWRADLSPQREAKSLSESEIVELAKTVRLVLDELFSRGGSHTGELQEERSRDGHCPLDGTPLRRESVGGRTTYWCPDHQR